MPLLDRQQAFAYTQEDLKFLMTPMAQAGEEPIGSMGNDSPLAVLSNKNKTLYHYFKQLFAQVTNPPIDPIREELVTSLVSFIGPKPNLLGIDEMNPPLRLEVSQPVLDFFEMEKIRHIERYTSGKFQARELDITYPAAWGKEAIEARLASLCAQAEDAVRSGYSIIIISDRKLDRERVAIPGAARAVGDPPAPGRQGPAHLDRPGGRDRHRRAKCTTSRCSAAYGAEAVHPYLALETLLDLATQGKLGEGVDGRKAIKNFVKAIGKGLKKVMSKMGISTYMSYTGAQIFEAVGLSRTLVDKYFTGTASNVEGIGLFEVAEEAIRIHRAAFDERDPVLQGALDAGGEYAWRVRGEEHMWTPDAIAKLQQATRKNVVLRPTRNTRSSSTTSRARHMTFRGLFEFRSTGEAGADRGGRAGRRDRQALLDRRHVARLDLDRGAHHARRRDEPHRRQVEHRRGRRGPPALRAGQSGRDAAVAPGQDRVEVDIPLREGDSLKSKIKQVASGRFGVTAEYLASAEQIQIKMAQGAKPGEGGQLPGRKVSEYIAELRYSTPGVELISPPPHHDIYSIEDLAQLIHDLKNANPTASITVKLVSEVGVGTVAAGVAKAKSDHVTISGHDGGTGASPWSSIKHAGTPWELGLAETQQTLVLEPPARRIAVQVDGQMKTGRDVVIGAMLGADEFGFATAPLVVEGCIMMRKCHLNTCPVGVATQDPVLRRKFSGKPEHVVNYFFFVAEEARELMAKLGVRKFNELIGRTDLLDTKKGIEHWKAKGLDFSRIFYMPQMPAEVARYHCEKQDHGLEKALDNRLIELAQPALERGEKVTIEMPIRNINRTVGTMLSDEIAKRYGHEGLPDDTIHVRFAGSAGQSFGAFLAKGVTLDLIGDTNDYCGKGLSGGRISVQPSPKFRGEPTENIITGNVVLYGAIAGEAYFRGVAGERFAVRNSGAQAVVEGVGDHGCEYMTGGTVVVLGATGRNFAAGMSGGIAYVLDVDGEFAKRCNTAMVELEPLLAESEDEANAQAPDREPRALHRLEARAGDPRASGRSTAARFVKVFPKEYRRALAELGLAEESGGLDGQDHRIPGVRAARGGRTRTRTARKKHYREFVVHLSDEDATIQGARCMDCGIPFCMSGCPVNNIIPDWNDLVYRQDWKNGDRDAALDQQLPRVHRPRLPGALRGSLRAAHQRRPGRHQVDRARHHRQGVGRGLGRAAAGARARPARRSPWSAPVPRASPARSSSRAPATP